jgi:hypothetical protein
LPSSISLNVPASSAMFDRVMTQSPTPIWEEGAGGPEADVDQDSEVTSWEDNDSMPRDPPRQVGYRYGDMYSLMYRYPDQGELGTGDEVLDPDGVVIDTRSVPTEPSSPDKHGEDMLLPER